MKKLLTAFIITAIPVTLTAAGTYYCGFLNFHGGAFIMWIITLVLTGLLIYFTYKGIIEQKSNAGTSDPSEALAILKIRLAKGELGEDEYNRLKTRIYE